MLEKKIRFNNKDWLIKIENDVICVFKCEENGSLTEYTRGCFYGNSLIEQCKDAIFKANNISFKSNEIKDFEAWDGDMDKEMNID